MFTQTRSDPTALERQHRRINRLKAEGIGRSTVLVHQDCRGALDELRPLLLSPLRAKQLNLFVSQLREQHNPINVSQVRQLSPFRYPGGKTWLVPEVRSWLLLARRKSTVLVEPFAGGAMVGLTVAAEELAEKVVLSEIDAEVAAVWETIFHGEDYDLEWLTERLLSFEVTLKNVRGVLDTPPEDLRTRAFRTLVKNRMQRGGIMAPGAGLVKEGEAGRGLRSRWYPETLVNRIRALRNLRHRVLFHREDAFDVLHRFAGYSKAAFFIDPPYTAGGKRAGSRLYTHNEVNHEQLFSVVSKLKGQAMLTYDDTPEIRRMAVDRGFSIIEIPMKNTHHEIIRELLIIKS